MLVGNEDEIRKVVGVSRKGKEVSVLVLLLVVSAERLKRDLLEVALARHIQTDVVILYLVVLAIDDHVIYVDYLRTTGLTVLFLDLGELRGDERFLLELVGKYILYLGYFSLKSLDLVYAVDDVLLIEVAELDLCDVFCLDLVNSEACHKVGDNVLFLFGVSYYADSLVYVKQYLTKA